MHSPRLRDKVALITGGGSGLGEATALFLASDDASYVNGHVLNVDGGFGAAGLLDDLHIPQ